MRLIVYFARQFLAVVALTLTALVVLVVAVTLVEKAGVLSRNDHGGAAALALAYFSAIEYAYQTLPVACGIGALVTGTVLAQRGEVLAVQAAGCGPRHLWTPFVAVGLCLAGLGGACSEYVLPHAIAGHMRVEREETHHVDALNQFYRRRAQWFREGDWLLYLPQVDAATATFAEPIAYRLDAGLIAETIEAENLRHDEQGWWLENAERHSVHTPEVLQAARLPLLLHVTPPDLIDVTGNPRELGVAAVGRLVARRDHAGLDTAPHRVELHNRWAYPLTAVGLVLMSLPWAVDPNRRRSLSVTLGGGVVLVAMHLFASHVFRLLALAHKIPAAWGAWGAPAACGIGIPLSFCLYRIRQRRP